MNSSPRRSLDILNLLAHLLELRLCRDDELRYAKTVGLRAHRVDLAVHLLEQEIELAPARLRAVGERAPMRDVRAEALHFFADVGPRGHPNDFLRDGDFVGLELCPQLADAFGDA